MDSIQHQTTYSSTHNIRSIHLIQVFSLQLLKRLVAAISFLELPGQFFVRSRCGNQINQKLIYHFHRSQYRPIPHQSV